MYPVFTSGTGSIKELDIDNITGPLVYIPSTSTLSCSNLSISNPINSTNTSAAGAGQIGFIVESSGTTTNLPTQTVTVLTSITLNPGTWMIIFNVSLDVSSADYRVYQVEISTSDTGFNGSLSYLQGVVYGSSTGNYLYGPDYMTSLVVSSTTQFTRYGLVRITISGTATGIGKMKAVKIA